MNILDEDIAARQRELLQTRRIRVRQIGFDVGRKGMKDAEIIPFLLTIARPTFFTRDIGYYRRERLHARYALVWLDIREADVAEYVRRVLAHSEFDTKAKRMGRVIRAFPAGLSMWELHAQSEKRVQWED